MKGNYRAVTNDLGSEDDLIVREFVIGILQLSHHWPLAPERLINGLLSAITVITALRGLDKESVAEMIRVNANDFPELVEATRAANQKAANTPENAS